jgi:hypothetical protein
MEEAATLAGSWRKLYAAKHVTDAEAAPWTKPTSFELAAAVQNITRDGLGFSTGALEASKQHTAEQGDSSEAEVDEAPRSLLFLVDGSGSVTEGMYLYVCMVSASSP